ncbi:T9SS type A sorting domain-containing protein [Rufibacter sp. XAAS-G3-1]|uniref:T9SS type A sorting domain-containing protein n=1 Tax=Rufibacter sp. XAAS-G3-1 TaxID=2729134 RepID=UPI0015E632CD|nr:T9SS type A sorting domain-containing protein [Rufibacter sp. XAAS-G3-1]
MKINAVGALLLAGILTITGASANAQGKPLDTNKGTVLAMANAGKETPVRRETLSGIDLFPQDKKGDVFLLSFQQDMPESGVLELTNYAGKVLYTKSIPAGDHTLAAPLNIGKLGTGTYLVEVKTSNTVYWKKMRVRRK